ncbi:hypothetical protein B7H19_28275 [Pseudomonas putida]|nr:hypothetical protein B7H19_28275 [Pseudomonas putida]
MWERACPRSRRRGVWHRLRRCSRACPLPQGLPPDPNLGRPLVSHPTWAHFSCMICALPKA